ncbi:MAG: bifunctional 5,10-methylenetetrahydrofolate dehydrogenase/5,10-methenyltetrahydrofolate cyclohydrolase [Patescibacteria group bacterium]|nr:bifunctional 5,10-methylenetetrahydrofolate dehydrogenase/5,10-methenyltetrahydrofolate cyclohydrolase [Patescibacteria group bacterium]
MQKISGKEVSKRIIDRLKESAAPNKILAVVQIGDDPASNHFIERKKAASSEVGVDMRVYRFKEGLSQDDLRKEVGRISSQKKVGGVIVQLPLPQSVNKFYVLNAIPREKDADVLGERALGSFYNGRGKVLPPAVGAIREILKELDLIGKIKNAAVIGPGFLVGKPASTWLLGQVKNLSVIDEGGSMEPVKSADVVISGAGVPGIIDGSSVKEGAVVIDFGYGEKDGKMSGDFLPPAENENKSGFYTPTPGGTGPVLVAKLLENFFILNQEK